jgi:dynamin 1-like protein
MHFLVNNSKESLQNDLVQDLYKEDMFEILLHEDPSTAIKRKVATEQLEALRKAKKVIQAAELRELAGLYSSV